MKRAWMTRVGIRGGLWIGAVLLVAACEVILMDLTLAEGEQRTLATLEAASGSPGSGDVPPRAAVQVGPHASLTVSGARITGGADVGDASERVGLMGAPGVSLSVGSTLLVLEGTLRGGDATLTAPSSARMLTGPAITSFLGTVDIRGGTLTSGSVVLPPGSTATRNQALGPVLATRESDVLIAGGTFSFGDGPTEPSFVDRFSVNGRLATLDASRVDIQAGTFDRRGRVVIRPTPGEESRISGGDFGVVELLAFDPQVPGGCMEIRGGRFDFLRTEQTDLVIFGRSFTQPLGQIDPTVRFITIQGEYPNGSPFFLQVEQLLSSRIFLTAPGGPGCRALPQR